MAQNNCEHPFFREAVNRFLSVASGSEEDYWSCLVPPTESGRERKRKATFFFFACWSYYLNLVQFPSPIIKNFISQSMNMSVFTKLPTDTYRTET